MALAEITGRRIIVLANERLFSRHRGWPIFQTGYSILLLLLCLCCMAGTSFASTSDFISGRITPRIDGSTLVLFYDLELINDACDSITIELPVKEADGTDSGLTVSLLLRPSVIAKEDSLYGRRFKGEVRTVGYGNHLRSRYALRLYRVDTDTLSVDTGLVFDKLAFYADGIGARRVSAGVAFFDRNGFPEPIKSDSRHILYRIEDRWGYLKRHYGFFLGYSYNHSKRFTLSEYIRLQGEVAPWERAQWRPVFHAATSYTRVKGSKGSSEFIKKGIGIEAGMSVDGKLESAGYSYSTAGGGFHRVDLFFAIQSGGHRIGTKYSLMRGEHVRMFAVTAYVDFDGNSQAALGYRNRRPFFHKALAVIGFIPYVPIALVMAVPLYFARS